MRLYKTIKSCGICKSRFTLSEEKGASQYYCQSCYKKYYMKTEKN